MNKVLHKLLNTASILALSLLAGVGISKAGSTPPQQVLLAQAALPAAVQKLLQDKRPASELTDQELVARLRGARTALEAGNLPDDAAAKLKSLASGARAEISKRQSAGQPAEDAGTASKERPTENPEDEARQAQDEGRTQKKGTVQSAEPTVDKPAIPESVRTLLSDKRDLDTIPAAELSARAKSAFTLSKDRKLPANVRERLAAMSSADRAELVRRNAIKQPTENNEQPAKDSAAQQIAENVRKLLRDRRPAAELPKAQLAERAKLATALSRNDLVTSPDRRRLAELAAADNRELARRNQTAETTPVEKPRKEIVVGDSTRVDQAAERRARAFLNDGANVRSMESRELRRRLSQMRDLLAGNALEPRTSRALRERLLADRAVLRKRLAFEEAEAAQAEAPAPGKSSNRPPSKTIIVDPDDRSNEEIIVVLRDRRPGDDLSREELRRRIQIYRDIERDSRYGSYDYNDRLRWRDTLERDREILRRRLLREREERNNELRAELDRGNLNIELGINVPPPEERDVFAAEADDEEIEDILVAPPVQKPTRRYTVEEIADDPVVRKSIPRVEIDTVHFGFNEAFVREEEIGNLDRIAAVMERILKRHPREVFLIEGHTDAVGSDQYNLGLSRARAEAIKRALITYYVIPQESLKTVGLGERFLKIPTPEAEAENRRVSISRVTQFLSRND